MSLIHIAGRIHRRVQKNRDGTYTYCSLEYALKSQRRLDARLAG